ncbi:MAG: LLM class flavin-dependent oxidoreductase [Acidimicrobiia bacterium]
MTQLEFWRVGRVGAREVAERSLRLEEEGWDGVGFPDSQSLAPEPYVLLALAAASTSTLKLTTAVTNPRTRHPTVTAAACATLQAASGGRVELGIGRGDSALAFSGLPPTSVAAMRQHLECVRTFLAGGELELDATGHLGSEGGEVVVSSLRWWAGEATAVPVNVVASGPRMVEVAVALGDHVTLAMGVDAERVAWGVGLVRSAERQREEARRPEVERRVGTYACIFVHDDRSVARERIRPSVPTFVRFASMGRDVVGPLAESSRVVARAMTDRYQMSQHAGEGSVQSMLLTDDVIDAFAIAGPPGYCAERLSELAASGIERFFLLSPGVGVDPEEQQRSDQALARLVLPRVREL